MEKKMKKGEDNKFNNNNIHTCVLKVNIHCDGCLKKVKKLLSKIDGVYTSSIDADQGKVTVVGNVDSATIIKKLCKAGKHAEEWPTKGGNQKMNLTSQLQKLQLDHAKGLPLQLPQLQQQHKTKETNGKKGGGNGDKGGNKEHKEGKQKEEKPQGKGLKDMISNMKEFKFPFKKEKKVKFNLPSDEDDDDDDYFDGDHSDFSDEFEDGNGFDFHNNTKTMKGLNIPVIAKDKKGAKGGQVQVPNKAKSKGGKNGGDAHDNKKKGGGNTNKGTNGHGSQGNNGKKGKNDGLGGGGHQPNLTGHGYMNAMNFGQMGNMQPGMGHMGQIPSMHGLPPGAGAVPAGYYNGGMAPQDMMAAGGIAGNPYLQQQYMQALLQQQQQQRMMSQGGAAAYPQMGYGYGYNRPVPPPPMYAPSSQSSYAMFSDENPNGCSIM